MLLAARPATRTRGAASRQPLGALWRAVRRLMTSEMCTDVHKVPHSSRRVQPTRISTHAAALDSQGSAMLCAACQLLQ